MKAFFGKKPETELADAKYDGKINPLDFIQIKLIIVGKEKEITVVDGIGEAVTVHKPVERIIVVWTDNAELIRILNAKDKVVGVDYGISKMEIQFPELSKLPCVGPIGFEPDFEAILSLNPDFLLPFYTTTAKMKEKFPGVAVVFLGLYYPDLSNPKGSKFTDGVRKLGYILNRKEAAEEYIHWRIDWIDEIKSRTEGLSEGKKQRVFICSAKSIIVGEKTFSTYSKSDTLSQMCILAGGKNIAEDLPEFVQDVYTITVDPEWVIEQNPDIIIVHACHYTWGGGTLGPSLGYEEDDPTGVKEGLRDELMNRPELANVNAVKTGNVYIICGNYRNDVAGGLTGAAYMARLFHPYLFEDVDPEAVHQDYLELQHFDYDLDEHGIFFYPPIEVDDDLAGIPDQYKG
jgi:iron complex transport system substrate-binding protein